MSEEDLNIKYICEITGLEKNDKLVPIILEVMWESYNSGLAQAEHDNTMGIIEENEDLKKQLEELEFIVGLRQKRNLISKFDKEYDEEDLKKNPNRDYVVITPDAEEVYRRYYAMKNQQKEFISYLENMLDNENDIFSVVRVKDVLLKYKEIIGVKDER